MKQIVYFIISIIIVACSTERTEYVARVKPITLSANEICNKNKVADFIFDMEELKKDSLINQSRQVFLKGIDAYKNKKQLAEATELFKQSILIYPDAKTYYELGNALLDNHSNTSNIRHIDSVYEVAEHLGFKPLAQLYYKKACVKNIEETKSNEKWSVIYNLQSALREGFTDTALFYSDKHLNSIVKNNSFIQMMIEYNAGKFKNNTGGLFGVFAKSFTPSGTFEVSANDVELKNYNTSISYDFVKFIPEMQNTSFGRDVSHDFYYVTKVAETPNYVALIYKSINFWGAEMQPVITKISTYNKEGSLISSKIFAAQFSAEKIKTGKFENNTIYIEDYKRIWKQAIDKVPFEENEVERLELIAKAVYAIDESGKIIEKSVPANYSDSSIYAKQ
ncbi:MAG: hypothetical protein JNL69_13160 [Bacteroidia bacterium]|nr:hypothetical protein [Bacteroidia bacterium]